MSHLNAAPLDVLKQQAWKRRMARWASVESLEQRRLFAATIDHRVLSVEGTGGDDVIAVTSSADGDSVTVDVNGGVWTFFADDFDRVILNGLNGNDRITVGDGVAGASLFGDAGNDTLQPGDGNGDDFHTDAGRDDYVSGGSDNDVVQYPPNAPAKHRDFEGYRAADATSLTPYILAIVDFDYDDRIADDVEHIIGGPGQNVFQVHRNGISAIPVDKPLVLEGGDDGDLLESGIGLRTTQIGGAGDDFFETRGDSDETLLGGEGNDTFDFGPSDRATSLRGDAGTDRILLADDEGTCVDLRLYPEIENVTLTRARQTAIGNDLDNLLESQGPVGPVTLIGGNGNDTLWGSNPAADGDDRLEGGAGDDSLVGWAGDDTLDGGGGADTLLGGDGDDNLDGGANTDTLVGGRGIDTLVNGEVTSLLRLDNGTLHFDGTPMSDEIFVSADGSDLIVSIEDDQEMFDIDDVTGIALSGRGGDDRLELDASLSIPATLDGGDGNDTLVGGTGNDVIVGGTDDSQSDMNDVLTGNAGDDALLGGNHDDMLTGGAGNDTLDGGFGADVMNGNAGRDTIDYSTRTRQVIVGLDQWPDDGEFFEGDFASPDCEVVLGGAGNDRLGGSDRADELHGMGGGDTIEGGGGDDSLFGWEGRDVIHGDDGDDYIEAGAGHDHIYGLAGNDTILGLAGNDWIFTAGDGFADDIIGGRGTDFGEFDLLDEAQSVENLI